MGDSSDLQNLTAATSALSLKDTTYFLTFVIFKVEDTLFKIPRYHFDKNETFAGTFELPLPPGEEPEGSSETKPIHLTGVSKKAFKAFLGILHPIIIPPQYHNVTTEDWKLILKLSDMWSFVAVRDLAIKELSTPDRLDAVSEILLGIKYDLDRWLVSGCRQLITRRNGPRPDEAKLLGEAITSEIWDIREKRIWNLAGRHPFDMNKCIAKAFNVNVTPSPDWFSSEHPESGEW